MVFTKQMCSICLNSAIKKCRDPSTQFQSVIARSVRDFSSKKYKPKHSRKGSENEKITIAGKNDFVTHELNSSIGSYVRRQRTIWNYVQEEERQQIEDERRKKKSHQDSNRLSGKPRNEYGHKSSKNESLKKSALSVDDEMSRRHSTKVNQKYTSRKSVIKIDSTQDPSDNDSDDYSIDELQAPNWDRINLVAIDKSFYEPSDVTANRCAEEIADFRSKSLINVDTSTPKPIFKFNELGQLSNVLITEIEMRGFVECLSIQAQGIPIALSGANMLAISQSGSGKTFAIVLSAVIHISNQSPVVSGDGPIGIILAPTPEMAEHIRQIADGICHHSGMNCTFLIGNGNQSRKQSISNDIVQLLVTTPDCLYEILRTKSMTLMRCSYFALYEADQMIDMCLDEEIIQIASQIRPDCQRLMWSKSFDCDLNTLALDVLNEYVRLDVGSSAVKVNIAQNVKQTVNICDEKSKKEILCEIVESIDRTHKTIVFTETPKKADNISKLLHKMGCQSKSLHYEMSAEKRDETLSTFDSDDVQFLVVTDVAAKNLTFTGISNVIHYDMPISIVDYANRVNRTGRSNEIGHSYAIVTEEDGHLADNLIMILQQSNQTIDPALFILKAANVDSDDEVSFAIPKGKGFEKYTIDNFQK